MSHVYVIQGLSNAIISGLYWLTLNQATLDFQRNVVSLYNGLVTVNFNCIAKDLSNTLISDDFCIVLPKSEQIINVRSSNARLVLIEKLAYHDNHIPCSKIN